MSYIDLDFAGEIVDGAVVCEDGPLSIAFTEAGADVKVAKAVDIGQCIVVTLEGTREQLAIFLEYYCYGDKEDAAFFLEESYEDLN